MRTRSLIAVISLGVAGSLWYGHAPPRSAAAYQQQAQQTAQLLLSQTETALLWTQQQQGGNVLNPATAIALQEAEADAVTTLSRFASYDLPAAESAVLRSELLSAGESAQTQLSAARIAAHAGAWEQLPAVGLELVRVQALLRPLAEAG